jgi:hypothetical protein
MFTYAQLKRLAVAGIGASALGLAAGIAAPTANADNTIDNGSAFIAALNSRGITSSNTAGTVQNARAACGELTDGRSQSAVASEWYQVDKNNNISLSDAQFMVSMSIKYFCPNAG